MSFLLKREMLSGHEMNSIEIDEKNECCDELEIHEDLLKIVQEKLPPLEELDGLAELFKIFG